jgi:hypothetical protein
MNKSWNEVRGYYERLVAAGAPLNGMLRLLEQIEASRYARGIYAVTSMHELCITQQPSVPDGPHLRISPLYDGSIEFRYFDTHVRQRQWHRIVKENDVLRGWSVFSISYIGSRASALRKCHSTAPIGIISSKFRGTWRRSGPAYRATPGGLPSSNAVRGVPPTRVTTQSRT